MRTLSHPIARALAGFALSLALVVSTARAEGQGVAWRGDYSDAVAEAGRTGRLVLVHVSASWCGPCKQMDKQVFSSPEVAQFLEQYYVPIKLDYDENAELMKSWNVQSLPADIVMLADGKTVVFRGKGFKKAATYCTELHGVAQQTSKQQNAVAARPPAAVAPPTVAGGVPGDESTPEGQVALPPGNRGAPTASGSGGLVWNQGAPATMPAQGFAGPHSPIAPVDPSRRPAEQPLNAYTAPPPTSAASMAPPAAPAGSSIAGQPRASAPPAMPANPYVAPAPARQAPPVAQASASNPLNAASPPAIPAAAPTVQAAAAPAQSQPASASAEPPLQLPPGVPPLAMDGYCPVTLYQSRVWRRGNPAYGVIHDGKLYLFVSEKEKQTFFARPYVFAPAVGGNDPVLALDEGQYVAGTRQVGCYYRDRLFLFASEETFERFNQNADRYASEAVQAALPVRR